MTPLQKAAQALIDNWDYPTISEYIAELRKALDAEIAQAPPPAFWLNECGQLSATRGWAERNSPGSKLTPLYLHPPQPQATYGWLEAVDKEMVCAHLGVANVTDTFDEANAKLLALINWHVAVATDPAVNGGLSLQPQATTAVPEGVLEAIRRSGHALVKTQFGYRLNFIGAATAQGEKP